MPVLYAPPQKIDHAGAVIVAGNLFWQRGGYGGGYDRGAGGYRGLRTRACLCAKDVSEVSI